MYAGQESFAALQCVRVKLLRCLITMIMRLNAKPSPRSDETRSATDDGSSATEEEGAGRLDGVDGVDGAAVAIEAGAYIVR